MLPLIAASVVIFLSALCSGTEAALFAVPLIRVKQLVEEKVKGAETLLKIKENMNRPISMIVIFNNVSNISGTILVASLAQKEFGEAGVWTTTFLLPVIVIIFSEILPKTIGEQYAEALALKSSKGVSLITSILTALGVIPLLEWLISLFVKGKGELPLTDETQIRFLTQIGHEEGVLEKEESEMIHRVFELNDIDAGSLMTPRVKMTHFRQDLTLGDVRKAIVKSTHSRMILIGENADDVVGMVYKSELLVAMVDDIFDKPLKDFIHPIQFVPEQAPADKLLQKFRESRSKLAIVTDQYSGVAGVVTIADVLEVLTGEMRAEYGETVKLGPKDLEA